MPDAQILDLARKIFHIANEQATPSAKVNALHDLGLTPHLNGRRITLERAIKHAGSGTAHQERPVAFHHPTGAIFTLTFSNHLREHNDGRMVRYYEDRYTFITPRPRRSNLPLLVRDPGGFYSEMRCYNASGTRLHLLPELHQARSEYVATPSEALDRVASRRTAWRWTGTRFVRNRVAVVEIIRPGGHTGTHMR